MVLKLDRPLWTDRELAEKGIGTLKSLQKQRVTGGGPPYVKIGRLVRYIPEQVERWLEEHQQFTNTSQYDDAQSRDRKSKREPA